MIRMPLYSAMVGMLAFVSLLAWIVWSGFQDTETAFKNNLNLVLNDNNLANRAVLQSKVQRLKDIAFWLQKPEGMSSYREQCVSNSGEYCLIGLASSRELQTKAFKTMDVDCGQHDLLRLVQKGSSKNYKIGATRWMPTGKTMAPIAHLFPNKTDWLAACFEIDEIRDIWRSLELPPQSSMALVRGADYRLWIREPFKPVLLGRDLSDGPLVTAMKAQAPSNKGIAEIIATKTDFVARTVQWSPIGVGDLILVAGYPKDYFYNSWLKREWLHHVTLGIFSSVIIILASFSWITMQRKYREAKAFALQIEEREKKAQLMLQAIEQSAVMTFITDADGVIEYVNPVFTEWTGYTAEEAIGQKPSLIKSDTTPDELYKNLWKTLSAGKEWRGELQDRRKSGEAYWASVIISPVRHANGQIEHYISIHEDITERKKLDEANYLANHDQLTGLANRRFFMDSANRKMLEVKRNNSSAAIVTSDIDNFKSVNDTYGHHVGDEVLCEFSRRLKLAARGHDVVARMGGEEFAILVSQQDVTEAVEAAERFCKTVNSSPFETSAGLLTVTASFGVSALSTHLMLDETLKACDKALYEAKGAGKNCVRFS